MKYTNHTDNITNIKITTKDGILRLDHPSGLRHPLNRDDVVRLRAEAVEEQQTAADNVARYDYWLDEIAKSTGIIATVIRWFTG